MNSGLHAQANEGIHPLLELVANGALLFCIDISHGAGTHAYSRAWHDVDLMKLVLLHHGHTFVKCMAGPSAHTGQTLMAGVPDAGSGASLGCELVNRMTPNRPSRTQESCIMGSVGRAVCVLATASPLV